MIAALSGPGCARKPPEERKPPPPVEAPVTAPPGLLAEGMIRRPAQALEIARVALSARLGPLPRTFPLAVVTVTRMSPLVVGLVEDRAPVPFAAASVDGAIGFAAVVRLTSGAELVAALAHGADAAFRARDGAAPGVTLLEPKSGPGPVQLGVFRDALLVGSSAAHVSALGPYLSRRRGSEEAPADSSLVDVVATKAALAEPGGPVPLALRAGWSSLTSGLAAADRDLREKHGGRAPDFGDPEAVLGAVSAVAERVFRVVGALDEAHLTVSEDAGALRLRAELLPGGSGAARDVARSLATGSASELLGLPATTRAALFTRELRPADAVPALEGVLGSRLGPADRRRLEAWAADLTAGLGDAYTVGLYAADPGRGFFLRTEHPDRERLLRSVTALPPILAAGAVAGPLEAELGKVHVATRKASFADPGVAGEELTFRRDGVKAPADSAPALELLAVASRTRGALVIGIAAETEGLSLLGGSAPTLASNPAVANAVARAGDEVWLGAVLGAGSPRQVIALAGRGSRGLWAEALMPPDTAVSLLPGIR